MLEEPRGSAVCSELYISLQTSLLGFGFYDFTIPRCFFVLFSTFSVLWLKEIIESFSLEKTLKITEV